MALLFKEILHGKVVIVGVGNPLRGDDGFGPALVRRLDGNVGAVLIDAGSAPENYLGKIAKLKPDTVLIVDAADMSLKPGGYDIMLKDDIMKCGFTTHDMSPNLFIEYLEAETDARIYMLGVQPKSLSFGEDMSDEVKKAVMDLAEELKVCMKHT